MEGLPPSTLFQVAEGGRDVTQGNQGQILGHFWSPTQYVCAVPGCSLEAGLREGARQWAALDATQRIQCMQAISEHGGRSCPCHCCKCWHSHRCTGHCTGGATSQNNKAWEPLPLKNLQVNAGHQQEPVHFPHQEWSPEAAQGKL